MIVMHKAENVTPSQPSPQPQVLQRLPHLSCVCKHVVSLSYENEIMYAYSSIIWFFR